MYSGFQCFAQSSALPVCAYSVTKLCPTLLQTHRLYLARFLCPWDFPGKNTEAGCHFLLQRIFPTQRSNPRLLCLLHWQEDSLPPRNLPGSVGIKMVQPGPFSPGKCSLSPVQFSHSVVSNSLQPHGLQHTRLPCPSPHSRSLLKLMSIESVMSSNHLILCHPPFSSRLQSFPASVFSNDSVLHIRWPKYWSFSFSISLSNEYSGLISFRIDWLDLLAV